MHREELVREGASIPKGTGERERGGRVAGDRYEDRGVDTRRSRGCIWQATTSALGEISPEARRRSMDRKRMCEDDL
ncbi:hypothetical protein FKM82_016763 [Ascaphus truei]